MFGLINRSRKGVRLLAGAALFATLGLALVASVAKADVIISAGADKKVKIWDPATGDEIKSIAAHDSAVNVVAVSTDGKTFATGGADKKVKVWDLKKGELIKELGAHGDEVTALAFSADSKSLLSGGADKKLKLWALPDGKMESNIDVPAKPMGVTILEAQGMVIIIAMCADGSVPILGKDGNSIFSASSEHKGGVTAAGGNSKETCLYTGGADGVLKWFSQAGPGEFEGAKHAGAINIITTSADFEKVLTGGADGKLIVWGASDHKKLAVVETGLKSVKSVAISGDGKRIFTGGDKVVKVWEAASGKEIHSQEAHEGIVTALIYVADKKKEEEKK